MPQEFNFKRQITPEPIVITKPNGEPIEVILGEFEVIKQFNGEVKTSHFITVGDTEDGTFKGSNVRLYVPLRGSYEPSDDEIIKLFQGESIFLNDLTKKDGGTYSGNFIFDMWADRSFTNRYGKKAHPNFTGELKFAPRNNETTEAHW